MADKRFSEWEEVSCNECSHYWDSSCDAVSKGARKPCTSFLATRSVVIPEQIKRLTIAVKGLVWAVAFLLVSFIIHLIWGG